MRSVRNTCVVVLGAIASLATAQPALARHRTQPQSTNGDPCAAPDAYVRERINKIKALQAATPNNSASLLGMFGGKDDFETKKAIEISQLRYDADGVNALLAAGGCKSFDLDHELSQDAK